MKEKDRSRHYEDNKYIVRANTLIQAKYKTTLFENKVVMIAMTRIRENANGELVSTIRASELKKYLNLKGENIYNALSVLSKQITHHSLFFEDGRQFITFNIVHKAAYRNGVFYLYFDRALKKYIFDLKGDFTKIKRNSLLLMNNNYTYRIYEILSVYKYHLRTMQSYSVQFPLAELKCMVGVINTQEDAIQKMLNKSDPDYEKIESIAKEKMFNRWYDFSSRVLDVAKKELAESFASEFTFEYRAVRAGRGGRVVAVDFTLYKNPKYDDRKVDEYSELLNRVVGEEQLSLPGVGFDFVVDLTLINDLDELIEEPMSRKDKIMLLTAAENDLDKIKKAYALAKEQDYIRSLSGWLKKAITEGWAENEKLPSIKGRTYAEAVDVQNRYQEYLNEKQSGQKSELQVNSELSSEEIDHLGGSSETFEQMDLDLEYDDTAQAVLSSSTRGEIHLKLLTDSDTIDDMIDEIIEPDKGENSEPESPKQSVPLDVTSLTPEQIEQLKKMLGL